MITATGAKIDLATAHRGAVAILRFLDLYNRGVRKASWRRSSWKAAGITKRKYRRGLRTYINGINAVLDGVIRKEMANVK